MPMVTSTLDWAGWLMYERKAYVASLTRAGAAALMPPDHPPNAAKGAWLTPLTAWGQVVRSHATSFPVFRSSTRCDPGRTTDPTLSMTFDVLGSMASVPMSPQSRVSAQRPVTKADLESPTSQFSS